MCDCERLPSLLDALAKAEARVAASDVALRQFADWFDKAGEHTGESGVDYLNEGGWDDLAPIGAAARLPASPDGEA